MKLAVIGAGRWGRNLVRTLSELELLTAVAETSPQIRAEIKSQYPKLVVATDSAALLDDAVDAVVIATPASTHYEIARQALEAGKDVFVEKPLAMKVCEAEQLTELASRHERILMVGHLLLYQPAIRFIKERIVSGMLGRVHSLHQERLNLGRARSVENALWSLGVHDVAVLLHLASETPTSVSTIGQCVLQPKIEDDVYLHLRFPSGLEAHLHNSWLWPERRRRLVVIAEKGMLVYDELTQQVVLHDKGITERLENRDGGEQVIFQGDGEPLKLEMQHFADAVRDRRRPISDGASAVVVLRVLEEAGRQLQSQ